MDIYQSVILVIYLNCFMTDIFPSKYLINLVHHWDFLFLKQISSHQITALHLWIYFSRAMVFLQYLVTYYPPNCSHKSIINLFFEPINYQGYPFLILILQDLFLGLFKTTSKGYNLICKLFVFRIKFHPNYLLY